MQNDSILGLFAALKRDEIPIYILFDDISPSAWVRIESQLSEIETQQEEIDVILFSLGGSADDSYRMIRSFRSKYNKVNIIIPFFAKSAATLFAFGASRIVLHPRGELGPIDAQIRKDDEKSLEGETSSALVAQSSLAQIEQRSREGMLAMYTRLRNKESSDEVIKIGRKDLAEMLLDYSAKLYAPLIDKIDPTELGSMARTLDIGRMYARRILHQYTETNTEEIDALLDFLVYECPDHGYVVDYDVLVSKLSFVIRAEQEPFGTQYCEKLGELSLFLLQNEWFKLNGFLDHFLQTNDSGIVNEYEDKDIPNEEPGDLGPPSSGSIQDEDPQDTPTDGQPSS